MGQDRRGAAGGKPESGPWFPFLRQPREEDRGDDDGFADMEGGSLIVGLVEGVEEGEERSRPVVRDGSGEAAAAGPEEEDGAGEEEGEGESAQQSLELLVGLGGEGGGHEEDIDAPVGDDEGGEARDLQFPCEGEAARGIPLMSDPVGEVVEQKEAGCDCEAGQPAAAEGERSLIRRGGHGMRGQRKHDGVGMGRW